MHSVHDRVALVGPTVQQAQGPLTSLHMGAACGAGFKYQETFCTFDSVCVHLGGGLGHADEIYFNL